MIFDSIIGPALHYPSESLGEPIQRVKQAEYELSDAIAVASTFAAHGNNAARAKRLAAFKIEWEAKAMTLLGKKRQSEDPNLDANEFSKALHNEVSAAIAIVD